MNIEPFFTSYRFRSNPSASSNSKSLAYICDLSGQYNIWIYDFDKAYNYQLTKFINEDVLSIAWFPSGNEILFLLDMNGSENTKICKINIISKKIVYITHSTKTRFLISRYPISPNGKYIAYTANEDFKDRRSIYVIDSSGAIAASITDNSYYNIKGWDPNSEWIIIGENTTPNSENIYIVSLHGMKNKSSWIKLNSKDCHSYWSIKVWIKSRIWCVTDNEREYPALAFFDFSNQQLFWEYTPECEVEAFCISTNNKFKAIITNNDGYSKMKILNNKDGTFMQFHHLPRGVISNPFFIDNEQICFFYENYNHPKNLYVYDCCQKTMKQLTHASIDAKSNDFIPPKTIKWQNKSGDLVSGFLYLPKTSHKKKVPVVIFIHGGPETQERPTYNPIFQCLLSHNIAVLAPNIHGSTGYGKSYQKAIYKKWGKVDLLDVEAGVKYLCTLNEIDENNLSIVGPSYGGFVSLAAVSRLRFNWKAAISLCGPTDLLQFVSNVPHTWKRFIKDWIGDPMTDNEYLQFNSPINNVQNIKCPILVIQGANDPRVRKVDTDKFIDALKSNNVSTNYIVYKNEGHGFSKYENWTHALQNIEEFLIKNLSENQLSQNQN